MKNDKKQIRWQFVEHYYPYLIEKLKTIDVLLQYGQYRDVYTQLRTLFAQLSNPIMNKDNEMYEELKNLINIINEDLTEYERLQIRYRENIGEISLLKMTNHKQQAELNIYRLYTKMMSATDKLNMFFPREKVDDRIDAYKS